jgi:hypothetical protein
MRCMGDVGRSRKMDGEATDIGRRGGHGFWTGGVLVGALLSG